MKKRYILAATALALLGLSTSACSSNQSSSNSSAKHTYKKSIVKPKAQKGFVGNTLTKKDGVIKINKITNVKVNDPINTPSNFTAVVVEASFTNKGKKSVSPEDWIQSEFALKQVFDDTKNTLAYSSSTLSDGGTQWDSLFKNEEEEVMPGKTINFALEFDLDKKSDKVTPNFEVQALDRYNQNLGKPYKVKAGTASVSINQD